MRKLQRQRPLPLPKKRRRTLQPKRVKHRKTHKGHRRGKAQAGSVVVFGDFALQAIEYGLVDEVLSKPAKEEAKKK